jgi:hypothetical protein
MSLELEQATPPVTSALRDRIDQWIDAAMDRMITAPIAESDLVVARIKGIRGVAATASPAKAVVQLRFTLMQWALEMIQIGGSLPTWDKAPAIVSQEVRSVVRISNLRKELLARNKQWGAERKCIAPGVIEGCLAEIDAVISRHAAQMRSAGSGK